MLKAKFASNYRSKKGNAVFVYDVTGTATELAAFKAVQGANYRESEKKTPLFFNSRYSGDSLNLIITTNGKLVVDNSGIEKMTSLVNGTSGILQDKLASLAAAQIFANLGGAQAQSVAAPLAATDTPAENEIVVPEASDIPSQADLV